MCTTTKVKKFDNLLSLLSYFDSEQKCIDYLALQRWGDNISCVYCNNDKVYTLKGENKRYKCASCRKQFSVKSGTVFENSKISFKTWFAAIYLVTSHKKGISSLQLMRDLGVTQKTAWFMLQRIRFALDQHNDFELDNEVEIDETYVGGKNKNRHDNKKAVNSQGRSAKDKSPVVGMVERKGKLTARQVANVQMPTLTKEIIKNVRESATIFTDEWLGYNGLKRIYDHSIVKHNQGQYVNGRIHTNTIEGFWSLLKRGIFGIYHFTSKKHLQKYVDEFVFRYNTRTSTEHERFNIFLNNSNGRLTYNELIK